MKRSGMLAKLRQTKDDLRSRMNKSLDDNGRWLGAVLSGHYAYFAVHGNSRALQLFYDEVSRLWSGVCEGVASGTASRGRR
jgi:RNA-directed DNA polymerase